MANIYLHKLDKFVEKLKENYDRGLTAQRNHVYKKLEDLKSKAIKNGDLVTARLHLKNMQTVKGRHLNDPYFRRLYYVRYATD